MIDSDRPDLAWRKSSYSGENGGQCVEVAPLADGGMAVRDSKDRAGGLLSFSRADWQAFVSAVKSGQFN